MKTREHPEDSHLVEHALICAELASFKRHGCGNCNSGSGSDYWTLCAKSRFGEMDLKRPDDLCRQWAKGRPTAFVLGMAEKVTGE